MNEPSDIVNDNPYTGKVITFHRDKRISDDAAVGCGTYGYQRRRPRSRVTATPIVPSTGDDAA